MRTRIFIIVIIMSLLMYGCNDNDNSKNIDEEHVGDPCNSPEDCYQNLDAGLIGFDIECLDNVEGGYCTHLCLQDEDCCAVEGECVTDLPQVCAPLESNEDMYCFVSCEDVDEPDAFCEKYVHPEFHCRSTGGGSENRKICLPN